MNDKIVLGGSLKLKNVINGTPQGTIKTINKGRLSDAVKSALLNCFQHVAWVDEDGHVYYDALYNALNEKDLVSISADFEQGQTVIYDDDTLDDLKQYLTVTGTYDDGSLAIITTYTLSGTLNPGTSSIQVIYEGKQSSFNVTVTHRPGVLTITNVLNSCTTNNSATSLIEGDSYTATITADSHYTLTGASVSITMGGVDITSSAYSNGSISIAEVTGSLVITITAVAITLASISAVYTQSGTVYDTDTLDSLKTDLVVTATYSDSSTETVSSTDYTLSGTLVEGTSTITVSYEGKTTTFTVTVEDVGNIFDGVTINKNKYINTSNGTVATSASEFATDMADVSRYAGQYILVHCNGASVSNDAYRIAFYASDESFISCPYKKTPHISILIPSNAKYMRIGGKYAGLTDITVNIAEDGIGEITQGEYYSPDNGTIVTDSGYARSTNKWSISEGYYTLVDCFTAVYYDSSQTFVGKERTSGGVLTNMTVPSTASYVGMTIKKANIATAKAYTVDGMEIGSVEYTG